MYEIPDTSLAERFRPMYAKLTVEREIKQIELAYHLCSVLGGKASTYQVWLSTWSRRPRSYPTPASAERIEALEALARGETSLLKAA